MNLYAAAYRERNRELLAKKSREYFAEKKEWVLEKNKQYRVENAEQIQRQRASYRQDEQHKEQKRLYDREYTKANPDKKQASRHRRRALKYGNGGSHTAKQRRDKWDELGNRCFYCGSRNNITTDHQTPISRGGTDNIDNIVPCCKPCNSKKGTRTQDEFFPHFQPDGTPTPAIMVNK